MTIPTFNVPPIGPRQGKVWGLTQLVFAHHGCEAHVINAKAGGFSSRHRHVAKWNRFVCISGKLLVRQCGEGMAGNKSDETIIAAGQIVDVPPGVWHQFEALEDTVAIELYWVSLDAGDIDRGSSQGGLLSPATDGEFWGPGLADYLVGQYLEKQRQELDREVGGCWETHAAFDGDKPIGYRVRWSVGTDAGEYLWVRHYLTDGDSGSPSLMWCKHVAERDAEQLNKAGRRPEEFPAYKGRPCQSSTGATGPKV